MQRKMSGIQKEPQWYYQFKLAKVQTEAKFSDPSLDKDESIKDMMAEVAIEESAKAHHEESKELQESSKNKILPAQDLPVQEISL